MELAGQHALVTGGSSGIGLAVAHAFASAGGSVTLVGRDLTRLEAAVAAIGSAGRAISGDITREDHLERIATDAGAIDHLVTAAGPMPTDGSLLDVTIPEARALFEGKFWGQLLTVRALVPRIRPRGSITMFSGTLARKPAGGVPIFASIDGAIESLGRVMAIDLAPIRVNVVAPGIIDTPMLRGHGETAAQAMLAGYGERVLVGRAGQPSEVADAVMFLIGNEFVSGSVLDIDGGKK
ncbi:MAG: SDR family oxidoreductase [Sphingomicrobium sp.]